MNRHTFIALGIASAAGLTPFFAAATFADDMRVQKVNEVKPATLAYPRTLDRTDATSMIGHGVEDITGQKVGAIEGIIIGKDGKVTDVVVGVGGFLGVGQRDVLVKWQSMHMVKDADAHLDKIVLSATEDQLKSMTAYKFDRPDQRRTVFDAPM